MYNDEMLIAGLQELSIPYDADKLDKLHKYYEMMVEKNKVMNLTSITEYEDVVVKHWLDSLCFAKIYLKKASDASGKVASKDSGEESVSRSIRLIDIGTGAGFPGIPIKIFFPEIEVTLLDSLNKRIVFLQDVVNQLGLNAISCIHGRAEEFSNKAEYRESYDYAVSRAVARLASLSELCIPFVKVGGYFLPYKSEGAAEEIDESRFAIKALGGKIERILDYQIPTSELPRKLVVVNKVAACSPKYPRGGGKPMKAPLLSK